METNETQRTVAVITIFYKERYLTSLVLDDTKTGDIFVEVMQCALNRKGQQHITFRKELRTVYDIDTIFEDLFALSDGYAEPQGALLNVVEEIDRSERR
ncbi:hypothetical protein [uncultured Alistipes sp.]|uniref:hypothetical protein n=1 Tax=uncultured Alistipes sp. TaxID=538949 RepID=UPI0026323491|nr:hypothetical protein [uncultured Alistipes sp.]